MVDIKKLRDGLTEIDGRVRIEVGPARKRDIATPELLGDATASHYHLPRREKVKDAKTGKLVEKVVHAIDAFGKPIKEGEPFDYIDWKAAHETHYVYRLEADPEDKARQSWQPHGAFDTYEKALSAALPLLSTTTEGSK